MTYLEGARLQSLEATVAKLAAECPISGNFGNTQIDYFSLSKKENRLALWKDYKGKRILDIGAGLSDFVAILLEEGADAYALDFGYGDKDLLIEKALQGPGRWTPNSRFLDSIRDNPERYIAGSAHKLPLELESDSFDAVLSHYGIFGVLDLDFEILKKSVKEAIRVLKPAVDSVIEIGPFQGGQLSNEQKANQLLLLPELRNITGIQINPIYPRGRSQRDIEKLGQLRIYKSLLQSSVA